MTTLSMNEDSTVTNLLNEAPAVAFTKVFSVKYGYPVHITVRSTSVVEAFGELYEALEVIANEYGFSPVENAVKRGATVSSASPSPSAYASSNQTDAPATVATAPSPAAVGGTGEPGELKVRFSKIVAEYAGKTKIAKLKGGKWMKFGVKCWPEVASTKWDLEQMEIGVEYDVDIEGIVQIDSNDNPVRVTHLIG